MLCTKLKECHEQKTNSINQIILPKETVEKESYGVKKKSIDFMLRIF